MSSDKNEMNSSGSPPLPWATRWRWPILAALLVALIALLWSNNRQIAAAMVFVYCVLFAVSFHVFRTLLLPELGKFDLKDERDRALAEAERVANRGGRDWILFAAIIPMFLVSGLITTGVSLALPKVDRDSYGDVVEVIVMSIYCAWFLRFQSGRIRRELRRMLVERGHDLCIPCGYDLTGNVSGVCPECGTTIPSNEGNDEGQE